MKFQSASINSDKLPLWGHASSTPNATSPNTRQSLIPRNFSGSSPVTKFPESSVSSLTVSSSLCESLPSKTHTESLIASPLPSLAKTPSNKTFVVLPEKKDFQNSTVIDWHNPSAVTSSRTSSIQHPSVTNSQDGVSTISTSNTSTTESSSSKLVARSDTFTRSDQKLFEQTQCEDRSGKSNAAVPGGRLSESQSRIPHLRATKCGSAIKKPHVSSAMQTSAGSLDVVEVEDKTYRSRLPVRSSYADGSSVAASGMQGCRTSVCDEVYLIYSDIYVFFTFVFMFLCSLKCPRCHLDVIMTLNVMCEVAIGNLYKCYIHQDSFAPRVTVDISKVISITFPRFGVIFVYLWLLKFYMHLEMQ